MTCIPMRRYCKPAFVLACALLACALLAGASQAGPVYKYRLPDGRIVYTSDKIPNAKLLDTLPEPALAQPVDPARQGSLEKDRREAELALARRLASLAAADAEIDAAGRALRVAKARQTAGVEPGEGDRIGTVRSGRGRASEAYLERQQTLQDAVDTAEQRLDKAWEARNAAR